MRDVATSSARTKLIPIYFLNTYLFRAQETILSSSETLNYTKNEVIFVALQLHYI